MHLAIICLFTGCTIFAQNIDVQPIPQQVSKQDGQINLPETYQLLGETEANPYAVQELKDLLGGKHPANTGLRIYIGEKGDKSIRKFTRQIPNQKEGYYLSINNKEIILAGNDERGTYYALQTLKQLLKDNQLPVIEIQDYPAIRYRGVVEGFYGTPWSHNARLRQLQFYGENKMNTYIYGPKDDPYHSSPNWRLPYPEKEAKQLQELVKVAQENEVDFVWAIHPGQDIKWNKEDRELLLAKFEKMYHLGVRSFAVFFDDISGEGTNPVKQAELLNYIDEHFVKVKPDVTPLIMWSGFVTNPMEHAEASKIAIYSVASYAWNPTKYNSEKTWKDAIMNILPDAATELEFFAAHNSDLGPNGHKYRREESVNLQPTAQSFTESYIKNKTYTEKDFSILQETFSQMVESSDILVAHADKNPIIVEIMPWLYQFKLLGETGNEVLAMVKAYDKNDQSLFMRKYKHVKALQQQMFQIDQTYNQNPYQPGIKTAGKVIKPLIDQTFATVTQCYNQKYSTLLNAETDYMPHKLISDISQIKNLPLQVKINRIQISPALEVIRWPGNGSLTIELDQVYPGENIEIDFGKPEIATWGSLEISANGKDWSKVNFTQENNRLTASLQQKPIKAVRFTNMQHQEQEIYLRRFIITIDK